METVADLDRLKRSHPMLDAVIDEQDGRRIRIGERWLFDFASCNYLGGIDLDRSHRYHSRPRRRTFAGFSLGGSS